MRVWVILFALVVATIIIGPTQHVSAQPAPTPSPLPSGCYTDSSGLPVCGPNWSPSGTSNCLATVLTCATVIQGAAYGMKPDNCTTDNGVKLQAAVNAAKALPGSLVWVPAGIYGFSTPTTNDGSNVLILGFGQGAGFGTGHFPNGVPGATVFRACTNLGGSPILSLAPSTDQEQAGNEVFGIEFDGNSNGTSADLATTGLYITGQMQPKTDRLSCIHTSGPCIHWQGSQIGGDAKGSVIFPDWGNIEVSQPNSWDGPSIVIDALPVGGVDWGDVFGGSCSGSFHAVAWNWPTIIVGRSDHVCLPAMQANNSIGAPTPTPAPSGSPSPTPFPMVVTLCGAQNVHFSGVTMAQFAQYRGESTNAASPEPTCAPPAKNPNGTTFNALQTFANSALPPGWNVGSLVFFDDYGDGFWPAFTNDSHIPFICFSRPSQIGGASGCTGIEVLGDTLGNISIGTQGTGQSTCILFAPGGNGNSQVPNQYQSFVDPNGSLSDGTCGAGTATYGFSGNKLVLTATASSGDAVVINDTGSSGGTNGIDVQNNGSTVLGVKFTTGDVTSLGKGIFASGVQPNGSTAGYAPEVLPQATAGPPHPQIVYGSCASVANAGTTCSFPNSFTFGGTSYQCSFLAEGSTPHYFSYDTKAVGSFKAYSDAGTPTVDYTCTR